jgi:hypothetical protein
LYFQGIEFGNGVFVASLGSGFDQSEEAIMHSSNGIVWTRHVPLGETPNGVAQFVNGRFFFGNAVSSDGLIWAHCDVNGRIAFNGNYVSGFSVSTNGTDWTSIPGPHAAFQIYGTAFGAGLFVNVGSRVSDPQTSLIFTSQDGFLWTYQREGAQEILGSRICYGNGRFVAPAFWNLNQPNMVSFNLVSFDGTSWEVVSNVPPVRKYLNGLFFGWPDRTNFTTSTDGIIWTTNSFIPDRGIVDIAYGSGTLVVLSENPTNLTPEIWQSDPVVNSPPATPGLTIGTYPGLTITGTPGRPVRIEYRESIAPTNSWQTLTNTILPTSPWLFIDAQSASRQRRFYRAVAQ